MSAGAAFYEAGIVARRRKNRRVSRADIAGVGRRRPITAIRGRLPSYFAAHAISTRAVPA